MSVHDGKRLLLCLLPCLLISKIRLSSMMDMCLSCRILAVPLDLLGQPKKNDDGLIRHISNQKSILLRVSISMGMVSD